MLLTPDDLQRIAARTLSHYDEHAQSYWEGTRDHDVSQNVDGERLAVPGDVTVSRLRRAR